MVGFSCTALNALQRRRQLGTLPDGTFGIQLGSKLGTAKGQEFSAIRVFRFTSQ